MQFFMVLTLFALGEFVIVAMLKSLSQERCIATFAWIDVFAASMLSYMTVYFVIQNLLFYFCYKLVIASKKVVYFRQGDQVYEVKYVVESQRVSSSFDARHEDVDNESISSSTVDENNALRPWKESVTDDYN